MVNEAHSSQQNTAAAHIPDWQRQPERKEIITEFRYIYFFFFTKKVEKSENK